MNILVPILVTALIIWVLACAFAGYRVRIKLFGAALVIGLGLNALWMFLGLGAGPLEPNAIIAQVSLLVYGLCAFGIGWLFGRLVRQWRESQVDSGGV